MASEKYLPSANEFTPNIIDLFSVLSVIRNTASTSQAKEEIRAKYFSNHAKSKSTDKEQLEQQRKLAGNVLIGLSNYQLTVSQGSRVSLTKLGEELANDQTLLKRKLASHLINNLCGDEILIAMDRLAKRGVSRRNKAELARELSVLGLKTKKGLEISTSTTDHTKFATWLAWCGILNDVDEVIEENYLEFIGRSSGLKKKLWALSNEQFLFLQFLWESYRSTRGSVSIVRDLIKSSQSKYGNYISKPDQVASSILKPLESFGFIEIKRTSVGRGGNSGEVVIKDLTFSLEDKDFFPRNENVQKSPFIEKSLREIFQGLRSDDTHEKGLALEELAIRIGALLNLKFLNFRERSANTGGAEVDVIFEHIGITYAKWLVQCKNTPSSLVHVSTIAKEVGNALLAHANVLLIVTTGKYSEPAKDFARRTIQRSNLQVLLIDGENLLSFETGDAANLIKAIIEQNHQIALQRSN